MLYLLIWTLIALPFGALTLAIDYALHRTIVKSTPLRIGFLFGVIVIGSWLNLDDDILNLPFLPRKRDFVECVAGVGLAGVALMEMIIASKKEVR